MTTTAVTLTRNDGSEEFTLKAESVDRSVENGLVTDSIISAASRELVGGKLVLSRETYTIGFPIQGMEAADYPNSGTYTDDDWGFNEELWRAAHEWGFDLTNGFDTLDYRDKTIDGVITLYNPNEDTNQQKPGSYDATLEFTHVDAFVSQ